MLTIGFPQRLSHSQFPNCFFLTDVKIRDSSRSSRQLVTLQVAQLCSNRINKHKTVTSCGAVNRMGDARN